VGRSVPSARSSCANRSASPVTQARRRGITSRAPIGCGVARERPAIYWRTAGSNAFCADVMPSRPFRAQPPEGEDNSVEPGT
jgi:hypothetical protein